MLAGPTFRRSNRAAALLLLLLPFFGHYATAFTPSTTTLTRSLTRDPFQVRGARHVSSLSFPTGPLERTTSSTSLSMSTTGRPRKMSKRRRFFRAPKKFATIYAEYAGRLWNETNPEVRKEIANDRVSAAIRQMQSIKYKDISLDSLQRLDSACEAMHYAIVNITEAQERDLAVDDDEEEEDEEAVTSEVAELAAKAESDSSKAVSKPKKKKKKGSRSVTFGAIMGAAVACWVFSGNYIFTGLFTLMTILGQLEYYRMIINTGVYPARRISVVGACSMFLTALFTPNLHQICLPIFGLWSMVWFLTMKRSIATIPEIATTFTGMFYLGYVPSFWVRIRLIGAGREPTRLAPLVAPILSFVQNKAHTSLPSFLPKAVHLPITTGAIFIFWSWLSLAFSDVGAYFVGKNFGKTKLGQVSPAAGATSPNKTVEGVLGGCAVSGLIGIVGAWVQRWPFFFWTGAAHGIMLGLLGLLGDLTASMLKRDAGLKDFGDLLPEHGGILDRVDSFVWTAPYSWLVCAYLIPALRQFVAS